MRTRLFERLCFRCSDRGRLAASEIWQALKAAVSADWRCDKTVVERKGSHAPEATRIALTRDTNLRRFEGVFAADAAAATAYALVFSRLLHATAAVLTLRIHGQAVLRQAAEKF